MKRFFPLALLGAAGTTLAEPTIEEIQVQGHRMNLVGEASSASEGVVSQAELAIRPLLRAGEVLETVPGMVATQHSGPGKANQFYLRGFNLDHGNDFATFIDDMPVNMRTHGHGQGYTDLNFLMPELIGEIRYQKGSYYPAVGDFSGAGAANIRVADGVENRFRLGGDVSGEGWRNLGAFGQVETGDSGRFIYGVDFEHSDGQFDDIDNDVEKTNLWLKQQWENGDSRYSLTFMGYNNSWNSAEQIPERAVDRGLISELGSLNTALGGDSSRYSLSGRYERDLNDDNRLKVTAYAIDYELDLFHDFTFGLNEDGLGDEIQQIDRRQIFGWDIAWTQNTRWGELPVTNVYGTQLRYDDIDEVGVVRTINREFLEPIRLDSAEESSTSAYIQNEIRWSDNFRTVAGLRYDYYNFDVSTKDALVEETLAVNGGSANDDIVTASLSAIYTVSDTLEFYGSIGEGFHSNDARGVVIALDPATGDPADVADALVDTLGYEIGLRTSGDKFNASIALWALEIDSELLFVGDSGSTEDTGVGSERKGVELTLYYYLNDMWTFDLEYAYSDSKFEEKVDGFDEVPGALDNVISAGVNARFTPDLFVNLRMRWFDDYALDGGQEADSSGIANMRINYNVTDNLEANVDILNLFDSDDRDIEYFYESQLPGEAAPVEDVHFHRFEPRAVRLSLEYNF